MSDLKVYITNRKNTDREFPKDYEIGFENFKIRLVDQSTRNKRENRLPKSDALYDPNTVKGRK
jgi:hypothetical protein